MAYSYFIKNVLLFFFANGVYRHSYIDLIGRFCVMSFQWPILADEVYGLCYITLKAACV